jgi:hypothetical protein
MTEKRAERLAEFLYGGLALEDVDALNDVTLGRLNGLLRHCADVTEHRIAKRRALAAEAAGASREVSHG